MKRMVGSAAAFGCCIATLSLVTGAQASSRTDRDSFKTMRKSATTFTWSYTNHRAAGTSPVNGETIQITSGDTSILQSVTFDGVPGNATGVGGAFSFFPITIAPGATATGTGVTSAPLPNGTTFKYYVTTDGFATSTNTFSVDSTLGAAATPAPKPKTNLNEAKHNLMSAISLEKSIVAPGDHAASATIAWGARTYVQKTLDDSAAALKADEIDHGEYGGIENQLTPVLADDLKAERALKNNDRTSALHWLNKGLARKEIALNLIFAAERS